MAAYGKRIPDGSFTAMSLKLATSCPDPQETFTISAVERQVTERSSRTARGLTAYYSAIAAGGADSVERQVLCRLPTLRRHAA